MTSPLERRRELAAAAQAQRVHLAVQVVQWSRPMRAVDGVLDGVALARRHPIWTAGVLLLVMRAWSPARRLGAFPVVSVLLRRWISA